MIFPTRESESGSGRPSEEETGGSIVRPGTTESSRPGTEGTNGYNPGTGSGGNGGNNNSNVPGGTNAPGNNNNMPGGGNSQGGNNSGTPVVITAAHREEITAVHQEEITAAGREAVTIMRLGGAAIILRAVPAPRTRHRAATRIRA